MKQAEFIVRFPGLKDRSDTFEFLLDESFFAFHGQEDWKDGEVKAVVEMEKKPDMVALGFRLSGTVNVMCDRCLEYYAHQVDTEDTLYLKFGDEPGEIEENIVVIPRDQHQVEISQYLYEFIMLSLPIKRVHPDLEDGTPGCDREMMARLEKHLQKEEQKDMDPRWDDLKKLIDKN